MGSSFLPINKEIIKCIHTVHTVHTVHIIITMIAIPVTVVDVGAMIVTILVTTAVIGIVTDITITGNNLQFYLSGTVPLR